MARQVAAVACGARPRVRRVLPALEGDCVPWPGDRRYFWRDQRTAAGADRVEHPESHRRPAPPAPGPGRAVVQPAGRGPMAPGDAEIPGQAVAAHRIGDNL